jgi:hypothetical protein
VPGKHSALEFARRHRLRKHVALQQVEAEIADHEKIRLRFDALGHRLGARLARNRGDLCTTCLLDPVVGASSNEFSADFHLDDRQIAAPGKAGAVRVDIVHGHPDIALRELRANVSHEFVIVDQVNAINRNQETVASAFFRKVLDHPVNKLHILQRKQWQGD